MVSLDLYFYFILTCLLDHVESWKGHTLLTPRTTKIPQLVDIENLHDQICTPIAWIPHLNPLSYFLVAVFVCSTTADLFHYKLWEQMDLCSFSGCKFFNT